MARSYVYYAHNINIQFLIITVIVYWVCHSTPNSKHARNRFPYEHKLQDNCSV